MDIIDRHFAAENAHDIEATLATYTDDIIWDDVTHPHSPFRGKLAVGEVYGAILQALPDLKIESVTRFGCGDHVVDEGMATGHLFGEFAGLGGHGAPVRFRLLHVFDLRNGLIARENAWFDTGTVRRQVERVGKTAGQHAAAAKA